MTQNPATYFKSDIALIDVNDNNNKIRLIAEKANDDSLLLVNSDIKSTFNNASGEERDMTVSGAYGNLNTLSCKSYFMESTMPTNDEYVATTFNTIDDLVDSVKQSVLQAIYPVGSIYTSFNSTSPATLFGFGTWNRIEDQFLYCCKTDENVDKTGGSATVTLTTEQMPPHTHLAYHCDPNAYYKASGDVDIVQFVTDKYTTPLTKNMSTASTGGKDGETQPHDNMPPYIGVYAWRRVEDSP